MKNRLKFWKHWLISLAGLAGLTGLTGCKELTCDFSYSPTSPAAGEVVTFTNASTGADDYYWSFGDNGTSTTSSPTHIYRKKGKYTVTLTIVRNKVEKRTRTQFITVIDTIPAIACDSSTIYSFTPIKFYASVYNPWKKKVTYQWTMPDDAVVLAGRSLDSSAVVCYLTKENQLRNVGLQVQLDDLPKTDTSYSFTTVHKSGLSVLYRDNNQQAWEQFTYIVNKKYKFQVPAQTTLATNLELLNNEQDTLYQYGGNTYTKAVVNALFQPIVCTGFQVDKMMGKLYAYNNSGLWVSDMTGGNKRQLVAVPVKAIKVDYVNNCLYWATSDGLWATRLMQTEDNQEPFTIDTVTTSHSNITKIAVNSTLH